MEPMITAPPIVGRPILHRRDGTSSSSSGLDTCGYLSGDYASPLTCGTGYTCSTGPSLLPSHLGCCNAVDCAPSSGAHTCITAESGTIPCTSDLSSDCIEEYTSLLFCTDPTAPACITYSAPPPTAGSFVSAGLYPTIFSYSCGPTQATSIFLATATNAPASATSHVHHPVSISHLPIWAYVLIGIGGLFVLFILGLFSRNVTGGRVNQRPSAPSPYKCRYCDNVYLTYDRAKPGNKNGNAGRPYYVCENQSCDNYNRKNRGPHEIRGWVTWADNIGITPGNPLCWCIPGRTSRADVSYPNKHFFTCATGACGYYSGR